MNISYRTRRALTTLGIILMVLVLVAIAVWAVWLLWLDRFVVYTRDGAKLDFSLSQEFSGGVLAVPPEDSGDITIYYNEGDNTLNMSTELGPINGYYADAKMLTREFDLVRQQIELMPKDGTVMLDMKDAMGYFFFDTTLGKLNPNVNRSDMESLLSYLKASTLYTIARIPAFRDYIYTVDHSHHGLTHSSGRYVYGDGETYWLDPTSEGVMSFLMQIVSELKALGFDEVVFDDFHYPDTTDILFKGDRGAALKAAADKLATALATDSFCVSFTVEDPTFQLPAGRTRMYLKNQSAGDAKKLTEQSGLEEPLIHLIFVTDVNDTRFDNFSVLRPITAAHFEE